MILVRLTILCLALFSAAGAFAQYAEVPTAAPNGTEAAPDAAAPPAPAATEAATAVPAAAPSCVPGCRDGFLCHEGQCISACNPPCAPGQACTQGGACVSAAPVAQAPQPVPATSSFAAHSFPQAAPSAADQPPPPGGWEQPEFESRKRGSYHFRPFAGLTMTLGGSAVDSSDLGYVGGDYDLDLTAGFEAGIEFRFGRIFGIAPAVRLYGLGPDGYTASIFDILLQPTFHIPIGAVEILIPLALGPEFASDAIDNSGTGFTFGVNPGVAIWVLPFLGFHAQFGFGIHYIDYSNYTSVAVRYLLNTGVDFAF